MLGLDTIGDKSGKGRAVVDPTNELMSGFRHCSGYCVRVDPPRSLRVLGMYQVLAASMVLKQHQKEQER